jgi:RNA polymerase sigma-70 factor (ECF subfamily)
MAIPLEPSTSDPRATSDAIAELYGRYGADLFRLAYRLTGTKEDAEDVLHDVFVGLPEKLERYEERGRLDAWLRRVTARVALMRLRSGRRRPTIQLESVDASSDSSREPQLDLQAAVDALPSHLRSVLVLKEIEGYSHAEIADMLGISAITSRVRLLRAMRKLRRTLGGTR